MNNIVNTCRSILMASIVLTTISLSQKRGNLLDSTIVSPPRSASLRNLAVLDTLPLAPNTSGLSRPIFWTIQFDLAIGMMWGNYSSLKSLTNSSQDLSVPITARVDFPLTDNPNISIVGGFGIAIGGVAGGNYTEYSALLLYRPNVNIAFIHPIVGIGTMRSVYNHSDGFEIKVAQSCPMFTIGTRILENTFDALLILPIAHEMKTTFEEEIYSIRPVGPGLVLIWHI